MIAFIPYGRDLTDSATKASFAPPQMTMLKSRRPVNTLASAMTSAAMRFQHNDVASAAIWAEMTYNTSGLETRGSRFGCSSSL